MTRRFACYVSCNPFRVARNRRFAIGRAIARKQYNLIVWKCPVKFWASKKEPRMYVTSEVSIKVFTNRQGCVPNAQNIFWP